MAASHAEVWQNATVIETTALTPDTKRICFAVDRPIAIAAGAHVDVRVAILGELDRRSYSVVDSSDDGHTLSLAVFKSESSRGGADAMHQLNVGDVIEMSQPLLDFPLRSGAEKYVLLAGGIGVTALMEMARKLKQAGAEYEFIYVGHSRSVMVYLDRLANEHGNRLRLFVSDEHRPLDVGNLVSSIAGGTELYMCGPIRLMDSVRRAWMEAGLPLPDLRFETFGNSGWHDPQQFIVHIPDQGITAVVGPNQSMLEALQAAGADMMYDCRKGECGLCEVRITALEGELDHRDVFYSERQKDARGKMCCCVSRAVGMPGAGPAVLSIQPS